jgi:pilus assembly protein TadC
MTPVPAALLALAAALLVWPSRSRLTGLRLRTLRAAPAQEELPRGGTPSLRRRLLLAGFAGAAAGVLVGGLLGVAVAAVLAVLGERWLRGVDAGAAERMALARELPGACDLLAVCLAAGVPVSAAVSAVGAAVPDPLGPRLAGVAALSRLGADPRRAWADVPPELAALGRVMVRAGESGATAVPALRALAVESRASVHLAAGAAVQRAGVWVLAPLGLCFLPAFVCLGVVPMVLGIAGDVFR